MQKFKGQIAVITGASSGIGRSIALSLASDGCGCFLIGRNKKRLEQVAKIAKKTSDFVRIYPTDLGDEKNISNIKKELEKDFKKINILIHSAGQYISDYFLKASIKDFDKQYMANIRAPYLLTQALLPMLRKAKGQVVFINSTQGLNASPKLSQFASTQHSIKAIADSLREEVNAYGIRVLSLFLGRTATPRIKALYKKEGKDYNPSLLLQPEDVASVINHSLSLPHTIEITNINIRPAIKSYFLLSIISELFCLTEKLEFVRLGLT